MRFKVNPVELILLLGIMFLVLVKQSVKKMYGQTMDINNTFSLNIYLKDFPVYPDAVLINSEDLNKVNVPVAVWTTTQKVEILTSWYVQKLKNMGWRMDSMSEKQDNLEIRLISFTRYDQTMNLSIIWVPEQKKTKIVAEFPGSSAYE